VHHGNDGVAIIWFTMALKRLNVTISSFIDTFDLSANYDSSNDAFTRVAVEFANSSHLGSD
jgi:hypothetical protein